MSGGGGGAVTFFFKLDYLVSETNRPDAHALLMCKMQQNADVWCIPFEILNS